MFLKFIHVLWIIEISVSSVSYGNMSETEDNNLADHYDQQSNRSDHSEQQYNDFEQHYDHSDHHYQSDHSRNDHHCCCRSDTQSTTNLNGWRPYLNNLYSL